MIVYVILSHKGTLIGVYKNKSKVDRLMRFNSIAKHGFMLERELNEEN